MTKGIRHGSVLVAFCLSLGACDGAGAPGPQSLEQAVPASAPDAASNPSYTKLGSLPRAPVAALPGEAGSVASVHDRAFANGFRQDIDLAGGAVRGVANGITVLARTSPRATLDEATPMFKPTEPAIRSELAHTFPHIAMQVVERPSKNAYGPYGLAIGRSGAAVRCLYAWQWIDQRDLGQDSGLTGPVAIRIRLCRADTTFDDLAALVDKLSIHPGTGQQDVADVVASPDAAAKHAVKRRSAAHRPKTNVARTTAPDRGAMWAEASTPAPTIVQPLADDLPPQAYAGPKGHVQGQQN